MYMLKLNILQGMYMHVIKNVTVYNWYKYNIMCTIKKITVSNKYNNHNKGKLWSIAVIT